jgi:chorismate mutase/prephenate dehydrogenase
MTDRETSETSLSTLREALNACDQAIVERLAERMRLVAQVSDYKQKNSLPTFDRVREAELLERVEKEGEAQGLSREMVRDVYAVLFGASRSAQRTSLVSSLPKISVGIIGGTAGMGAFFARELRAAGFTVEATGVDAGAPNVEVASRHDLVVVAVPIVVTEKVIREIGPHVRAGATLIDVTSVKRGPLAAMLESTAEGVNVVGTHPMFGPSSSGFDRQKVVLCKGRGDDAFAAMRRMFEAFGAECIEATADEHDAQMALIQVLVHEKTMVLGSVLERLKAGLGRSLDFASPIYRTELAMIGRMFSQGADLYADILTSNPDASRLSHLFEQEAAYFARAVAMHDRDTVIKRFKEVASFMQDFAAWAKSQSDAILRDLVRHG